MNIEIKDIKHTSHGQILKGAYRDGSRIGTVYDNLRCKTQHPNFVFHPRPIREFSVWLTNPSQRYLTHAEGVRSNDWSDFVARIEQWMADCDAERNRIHEEFREAIDALPEVEYELRDGAHGEGVSCKALGGDKMESVKVDLAWGQIAKLLAHSYDECQQWQAQDIRFGGCGWNLEWRYVRDADTIELQTYGGTTILSAKRSEAHKAVDQQGVFA